MAGVFEVSMRVAYDGSDKRTFQLLVTEAHPLALIPQPLLDDAVNLQTVLDLTRIDAIPAGILAWGVSGFTEGMGEQALEIFTSRARCQKVYPFGRRIKVGLAI
jgi:hypothetical protein